MQIHDVFEGLLQVNYDCYARASNYLSILSEWDGGIALDNEGANIGGRPPTGYHSELFVTKNLRDVAFGYPNSLAGLVTGFGTWSEVFAATRPDVNGLAAFLATLGQLLASESRTTDDLFQACGGHDGSGGSRLDFTPDSIDSQEPYSYMEDGMSCEPMKAVFDWFASVPVGVGVGGGSKCGLYSPIGGCACADQSGAVGEEGDQRIFGLTDDGTGQPVLTQAYYGTQNQPCCLTIGGGCLTYVDGYVVNNYVYRTEEQAIAKSAGSSQMNTGCR
jgi:hypothetical protein